MSRTPCVLYVEDNPQNRTLVKRLVESRGWLYHEVEDGHQALTWLQSPPRPDVILMDLAMPVLDGYQTTRMIKDDPTLQAIPVVALTAHAMPGDRKRAEQAGCDHYLTKPIDTKELMRVLTEILASLEPAAGGALAPVVAALEELIQREGSPEVALDGAVRCLQRAEEALRADPPQEENA